MQSTAESGTFPAYTEAGDNWTSGNGSVMRLAPVAIYFRSSPSDALQTAALQSRTTHRSDEAAECARLLAHIILVAMSHPAGGASARVEVLGELHDTFTS